MTGTEHQLDHDRLRFYSEQSGAEDIILFVLAGVTLIIAALLAGHGHESLSIRIPFSSIVLPIPGACWFKFITGIPCPGCGLTRSFAAMADLDPVLAYAYNPGGVVLFILFALQIPYRPVKLIFHGNPPGFMPRLERAGLALLVLSVALMILSWILKILMPCLNQS
jgi:hypothetical protein